MPIICNPLNLPYRYQDMRPLTRSVYREAADPSVVLFCGRYYLFASMSGGFWHSEDLVTWEFRATEDLPINDYAPDIREIDGYLYFSASKIKGKCSFYRTTDPLSGKFEEVPGSFAFFDPNLFCDDDGRVYLYWGCSNRAPIWGVELDPHTMTPLGERHALISTDTEQHGWERIGENHDSSTRQGLLVRLLGGTPFIEGAWMTKRAGIYYLQYAAPATEANIYADGYYTADSPLGPFRYAVDNPFSLKPGGFITGAGHGSTFCDVHGNWWHAATMRISVNHNLERRIGLFPAGFDEDGVLFCNQNFADYPMFVPDRPVDPWTETFPGWMLLSYRKPVTATSSLPGHGPELALNEDIRTWWVPATRSPGQSLTIDLGAVATVHAVQVNLADHQLARVKLRPTLRDRTGKPRHIDVEDHPTAYVIEGSLNSTTWQTVHDNHATGEDAPHGFVVLNEPHRFRYVRITGYSMPFGGYFTVSGLRVFGRGDGAPPKPVQATAVRTEARNARISWTAGTGTHGFNVRYGRGPAKLYHSWMVYEQHELNLSALTAGETYWVAVDAFNENGITPGKCIQACWVG